MKPKHLPEITGNDAVQFLKDDAKPMTKAEKDYVAECRSKYSEYFNRKK